MEVGEIATFWLGSTFLEKFRVAGEKIAQEIDKEKLKSLSGEQMSFDRKIRKSLPRYR